MKRMMIQYTFKPGRADENQQYVEKVFEELRRNSPLMQSASFKAFQSGIKDRCEVLPVVTELTEVGSYRFFDKPNILSSKG